MPNYVVNKLTIKGDDNEIEKMLLEIENDNEHIDFNKIVPMPTELSEIDESSRTYEYLTYYLTKTEQTQFIEEISKNHSSMRYSKFFIENKTDEELNTMFKEGERFFNIYKKYGFVSWYPWAIHNWGVKWNASDTEEYDYNNMAELYFTTAWYGVPMLIEKLVKKYPNLQFEYKFADENAGYNCAIGGSLGNGEFEFFELEDMSKDAKMVYMECWRYSDECEFDELFDYE